MNHITKKSRHEISTSTSSLKNQSDQTNEISKNQKKPVFSSKKLDVLLDQTDELLSQSKAWKNDDLPNEAKDSLVKTARLMRTKTSDSQVNKAKRQAFSESEQVSNYQNEKFGKLLELAPISVLKEITEIKKFPTLNTAELCEVLFSENAFAIFKNTEEGFSFATSLLRAINKKISEMEPGDKGFALVLRFPSCYNNIGHIALSSVWRDTKGKLQLSICHQESVIPHIKNYSDRKPQRITSYIGIIYNTFDTSADYPNNISPVIESMKLCGPPSVLIFPCPYPENLEKYTAMMKDTIFDYGAADPWRIPNDKKIAENLPFQTCFNVTQRGLAVLYGLPIQYKSTLAGNFDELSKFAGVDDKITEKYLIGKNEFMSREEMKNLINDAKKNPTNRNKRYENIIGMGFVQVGENWINTENADIKGTTQSKKGRVSIQPGNTTFSLPKEIEKFKFATENKLLENLEIDDPHNKLVIKDKIYSSNDVKKIQLKGISNKPFVFDYVYTIKKHDNSNQVIISKAKL